MCSLSWGLREVSVSVCVFFLGVAPLAHAAHQHLFCWPPGCDVLLRTRPELSLTHSETRRCGEKQHHTSLVADWIHFTLFGIILPYPL